MIFFVLTVVLLLAVFAAGLLVGRRNPSVANALNAVTSPLAAKAAPVVAAAEAKVESAVKA